MMYSCTRILSALFAVALLAFAAPAHADELASIMAAKVIKAAVPQDFAPFGSVGLDMKPQGYDIDMANLIGNALGVKVELIPVTTANRIAYLQTHKVGGYKASIAFTRGAGGLACTVRTPLMREAGMGNIRRDSVFGGDFEIISSRQTSSSCRVAKR